MSMEKFYNDLKEKKKKIAIVGLGYVGIPILINLKKHFSLIGFDVDEKKIFNLRNNINLEDITDGVEANFDDCILTSNEKILNSANFFIVTVPTPVDTHNNPDLKHITDATKIIGRNMPKGSIIVYESTVYPGLTEDYCIPLLEKESGYKNQLDFWVGYSPERINPGDKSHTLENIVKVVSAQDKNTLKIINKVYSKITKAGVYEAESIKVAEAAKVIENIQRDLNIALINELSIIFSKLGIDTTEVLNAAKTKWNFLDFKPGLVGGHCIGVDPFYLTYKASELGYHPEVILAGRRINENMSYFIGNEILKRLFSSLDLNGQINIVLFGITFKENIKDIRNTKVVDLYNHLKQYGLNVMVCDPIANKEDVYKAYKIEMIDFDKIGNIDAAVFCVAHECFKNIDLVSFKLFFKNNNPYIFDIKGIFNKNMAEKNGFKYWRL